MTPWTIKQLYAQMQHDLENCASDFERDLVRTLNGREIVLKAAEWAEQRKLTPAELAIAQQFGYCDN